MVHKAVMEKVKADGLGVGDAGCAQVFLTMLSVLFEDGSSVSGSVSGRAMRR